MLKSEIIKLSHHTLAIRPYALNNVWAPLKSLIVDLSPTTSQSRSAERNPTLVWAGAYRPKLEASAIRLACLAEGDRGPVS